MIPGVNQGPSDPRVHLLAIQSHRLLVPFALFIPVPLSFLYLLTHSGKILSIHYVGGIIQLVEHQLYGMNSADTVSVLMELMIQWSSQVLNKQMPN